MSKRPVAVPNVSRAGLTEKGQIMLSISGDQLAADNRVIIDPTGYYPNNSDFDGFAFDEIRISSPNGDEHTLSFNEDGVFLVDGESVVKDKVTVTSPNGTKYNVIVDDDGKLTTEKEVENDNKD
ncbi:hypothetical protein [Leuconostoc fallax]|uniref:hypothetical protein n=1 Tax=Leuconostoc fallax TaxID=1251 RepID=UPI001C1F15DC|nr:hypothetical protein [Leuconostoc fallax]MBU7455674.1 hypothetical protein [Leuconostoc fallax]